MPEIIPSINVSTFTEVQERIAKVEPYVGDPEKGGVEWCHLDVTDGVFSKHLTWHDPRDLATLRTKLNVEVHLMMERPEETIDQWLVAPIKRVIVHLEALRDPDILIQKCRDAGIQIGFAIRPDTSWEKLKSWFEKIDLVCILRVPPGASGQRMQSEMLGEIAHVRNTCPECIIEIDGGVAVDNAKRAVSAGANLLVAGTALLGKLDIGKAIKELKSSI